MNDSAYGELVAGGASKFASVRFPGTGDSFLAVVDVLVAATRARNARNALAFLDGIGTPSTPCRTTYAVATPTHSPPTSKTPSPGQGAAASGVTAGGGAGPGPGDRIDGERITHAAHAFRAVVERHGRFVSGLLGGLRRKERAHKILMGQRREVLTEVST